MESSLKQINIGEKGVWVLRSDVIMSATILEQFKVTAEIAKHHSTLKAGKLAYRVEIATALGIDGGTFLVPKHLIFRTYDAANTAWKSTRPKKYWHATVESVRNFNS